MPVLVVMREAGESGHRTSVVVLDPLDHLPHLLPPLLLLQKPRLISSPALPALTHTKGTTSCFVFIVCVIFPSCDFKYIFLSRYFQLF